VNIPIAYLVTPAHNPLHNVVSDEGRMHSIYRPTERVVVKARSMVRRALTIDTHLCQRVRVQPGNRQLAEMSQSSTDQPIRFDDQTCQVQRTT
jgi:hypothetical protein